MAALTITATQVLPTSTTVTEQGTSGATLTAGCAVYLDTTTNTWKLIDANDTATNVYRPGIALNAASASQPVTVAVGGTISLGAGAAPTLSTIYIVGATPGDIAPASDLASNWRTIILGVGGATNTLIMNIFNSGATKA